MSSLPDSLPLAHTENNLFLALLPDSDAARAIDRLASRSKASLGLAGTPLGLSRYHLSLHSFGHFAEIPAEFVTAVGEIFTPMAARTAPFEVCLDHALTFETKRTQRPFVLCSSRINWRLLDLFRRLGQHLGRNRNTFTPHVTMLYDEKSIESHPVPPVTWTVRELVLIRSYVGLGRHDHLARWSLATD